MIDFACKRFDLDSVVKCGLGLTRAEFLVMKYFLGHKRECRTSGVSKELGLKLSTVQKAVRKLYGKEILVRHQKNLEGGGYVYTYECVSRDKVKQIIKDIVRNWGRRVEDEIDKW